jgi:C1A family cysteine protease
MRALKIDEIPTDSVQATVPTISNEKSNGNSLRSEVSPVLGQSSVLSSTSSSSKSTPILTAFPTEIIDWRIQGMVTRVKNQANCGSCWAFATTAFFESELVITAKADNTVDLAEEFLLTCDTTSLGCKGGYFSAASKLAISKGFPL